jgi:ribosome-associated translation inhibitor RaiA
MTGRVQITFRRVLPSEAVREVVLQKFEKLCSRLPTGARCHVVIDRASGTSNNHPVSARLEITSGRYKICTEGLSPDMCQAVRESFERACVQSERRKEVREARPRLLSYLH